MPRVLLLLPTTTYRAQAFLEAAGRLGVDVTVASEEASTVGRFNPSGLLTVDFSNPSRAAEQVCDFSAKHPLAAVIAVDDRVAVLGAAICTSLGLPTNSAAAAQSARNKHHMRDLLARSGIVQPRYRLVSFQQPIDPVASEVEYPCVVKPLTLSASQGVIRADDAAEFAAAVRRLHRIVPSDTQFLVEQFVPGPEFALEGILTRGTLRVLALLDKPDPLDGPFFEETIYVTPSRLPADVQQTIASSAERACRALGLEHGPVHVELRLGDYAAFDPAAPAHRAPAQHGAFVIEVNPRSIGGMCSRVLRFGTGLSLEELIIRHAIDPDCDLPPREHRAAGVMMIPIPRRGTLRELRGLEAARRVANIDDIVITARPGQRLVPLPEGSLYLGFLFARADNARQVEASLREAHGRLEFDITTTEDA